MSLSVLQDKNVSQRFDGIGAQARASSPRCIDSMLPMQRNRPPKESFNITTGLPAK